ncbi:MAG: RND family efflux transporter MFP subunit [Kiritimatiellia bacterium]|jgi:RND family efflux transporter MFP subunit
MQSKEKNMTRQLGSSKIIIILVLAALVGFGIYWLRPQPKIRPPVAVKPPIVSVVRVVLQRQQMTVDTQGTVMPSREINLVAEVSGRVTAVNDSFSNGGFFNKDDVLVSVDARDYQYRLVDADAQVAAAQRELALEQGQARQAKREWRELGNKQANALSQRMPQVRAAEAQLRSAIAQRSQAKLNLQRTNIRSPFRGRVQSTKVNVGQYVTTGTVVAQIYDSGLAEVRLPLNDKQVALIGLPLGVMLTEEQQPAVILSAQVAGKRHQWPAKLTRTEASIDSTTRFHFAVVQITEPFNLSRYQTPLLMGLFVDASVAGIVFDEVIKVPEKAIVDSQWVYVVDDSNQLQQRKVIVLGKKDQLILLQGDVKTGEALVVSDAKVLQNSLTVTKKYVIDNVLTNN